MLRLVNDEKQSEYELRRSYIIDNIGLSATQAQIIRMILHDTTILTDHEKAIWTCIERSVEFMMQRIQHEQLNNAAI